MDDPMTTPAAPPIPLDDRLNDGSPDWEPPYSVGLFHNPLPDDKRFEELPDAMKEIARLECDEKAVFAVWDASCEIVSIHTCGHTFVEAYRSGRSSASQTQCESRLTSAIPSGGANT